MAEVNDEINKKARIQTHPTPFSNGTPKDKDMLNFRKVGQNT
jgi:hypothetical protein